MSIDLHKGIRLKIVDSTNEFIKDDKILDGSWVIADAQTAGKGRKGRKWEDFGEGAVFFSTKVKIDQNVKSLPLLPIIIGLSVIESLENFFEIVSGKLKLKWPNDIYKEDKKVSGILIESEFSRDKFEVIIGIGINLYQNNKLSVKKFEFNSDFVIDNQISDQTKMEYIQCLIRTINKNLEILITTQDYTYIELNYNKYSYLIDKKIKFMWNGEEVIGNSQGIAEMGELKVKTLDDKFIELNDTPAGFTII